MLRHGGRVEPHNLIVLLLLAAPACTAPAGLPPAGLGGVRGESTLTPRPAEPSEPPARAVEAAHPGGPPAVASDADIDVPRLERSLRDQLATSADPTEAALELADLLGALERHREALDVVTTALQRVDAPALQVCRAGLLRDLGRPRDAAAALLALAQTHGPQAMHPGLLFECAELQWLVDDAAGATATLRDLERVHADDPWCTANRLALDGLAKELATHGAAPRARVRDLLASLRGGGSVSDRIRLLGELLDLADRETAERREYLRTRTMAIACGDDSPAVRARAVQLADLQATDAGAFLMAALADEAALVRRFAAERTAELEPVTAVPALLDALRREQDPAAFLALHESLRQLLGDAPPLPAGDEQDPAARARLAADWEARCRT